MKCHKLLCLIFLLVCSGSLLAQDPRGTIVGKVSDATGGVLPGATVHAINAETGLTVSATANTEGQYEIPYLLPGTYKVDADNPGFKRWSRRGVELRMGDRIQIDVGMSLGDITEVVEVTSSAPVLDSTTSTVSQVMSSEEAASLPQRGGNLAWIYGMTPGVVIPGLPAGGPWNVDQSSAFSVAGSSSRGLDFSVDGVSNNSYEGNTAFTPPPDMVQEVRVQTATYDATIGHTTGGSLSISLKSGTNRLTGSASVAAAWGPMMTRNFFTNLWIFDPNTGPVTDEKIKSRTPVENWKKYSVAVGGPVVIPKLYDGRNKTFWMFGYQGHNRQQPVAQLVSVPTAAQRKGDFSALLALGSQYQIYDPFTTTPSGSRFRRNPLPGNIIPATRIHPTGQKLVNYYPLPNTQGTADGLSNYSVETPKDQIMRQPVVKIDHNFSEKHRMFARYSHSDFTGTFDKYVPDSTVRGRQRKRPHRGAALDNVFVLSPRTVLDVRYGITWFSEVEDFDNKGWDISEFFTPDLVKQLNPEGITFPNIQSSSMLALGNAGGYTRTYYTHSLLNTLTWILGDHSLKMGADMRWSMENNKTFASVSPRMDFNTTYTRGPLDNSPSAPIGQGIASLLFGLPDGGNTTVSDSRAEAGQYYSLFLQDDWRINRKLTLNLGLRWEYESPLTERFNRGIRQYDFATVNPIQAEALANYAKSPIPEIPVSQFKTIGGLTFLGLNGNPRGLRDPYYSAFMPRLGFAYQLTPRMVLRAGYGIFFGMLGSEFYNTEQPGYSQATSVVSSVDNGITYVGSAYNPLPFGVVQPQGSAGGLRTNLGRGTVYFDEDGRRPYTQRFSVTVQFEPFRRTVIEVGYLGSKTVRARVDSAINPTPRQYLSTSPSRDQAVIDYLSARVNNPFRGIAGFEGSTMATATTVTRAQLLSPYPHFAGVTAGLPAGSAWYNALTVRLERRFTSGLQFRTSYTWSKSLEALSYLNETDSVPEHGVANLDRPHRLVVSSVYELPFGKGRRFLSDAGTLVDYLLGGWQIQGIYQFQSGPPMAWGNVIYYGTDWENIKLSGNQRTLDRWFETSQFERNSTKQLGSNIRTFPTRISSLRSGGISLCDLSLFKNLAIWERMKLQIRAEAENIANHPMFDPPNMSPSSTNFGKVTGTLEGEGARRVFIGLKLIF